MLVRLEVAPQTALHQLGSENHGFLYHVSDSGKALNLALQRGG